MAALQKTLSFPVILIITINSIMGTGIFFLPALGAATAGPTSIISWFLMAAIAMGIGLVFAELVGMYPKAGVCTSTASRPSATSPVSSSAG